MKDFFNSLRFKREVKRDFWLVLISLIFLFIDAYSRSVIFSVVGIFSLFILVTHYTRKLLLPYLDLEKFINKANETSFGSALVFIATMYFYVSIAQMLIKVLFK